MTAIPVQNSAFRAYCGLRCDQCEVYLAGQYGEEQARANVARNWSARYGWNLTGADIHCSGCRNTGGEQFLFCGNCTVRQCAIKRSPSGCAACSQAVCALLTELIALEPAVQKEHDQLQAELKNGAVLSAVGKSEEE